MAIVDLHQTRFTFTDKRDPRTLYTFSPNTTPDTYNGFIMWIAKDGKPEGMIEPLAYVMKQLTVNWIIKEIL